MPRLGIEAIRRVEADANRSADTHLHVFPLPAAWGMEVYFKDESVHPTGSLKHRLARSLFLYALVQRLDRGGHAGRRGELGLHRRVEAYFARLIGVPFIAVMPRSTSPEKIAPDRAVRRPLPLRRLPPTMYGEAQRLADECGGHYIDQFTYAERATDWRGNNNIAESIFEQLALEPHPVPEWIVIGAGTGGTSATIGRYLRYRRYHPARGRRPGELGVLTGWSTGAPDYATGMPSRIEGIGRPRMEPSFVARRRHLMIAGAGRGASPRRGPASRTGRGRAAPPAPTCGGLQLVARMLADGGGAASSR